MSGPDLRAALSRANWREHAEEAIEGAYKTVEVDPALLLRALDALAADLAPVAAEYGRPPLDPATKAHDDAYMAGLIRGRALERDAQPAPSASADAAWGALGDDLVDVLSQRGIERLIARHRPAIEAEAREQERADIQREYASGWAISEVLRRRGVKVHEEPSDD